MLNALPPPERRSAGAGDTLRGLGNGFEPGDGDGPPAGPAGAVCSGFQPQQGAVDVVEPLAGHGAEGQDMVPLDVDGVGFCEPLIVAEVGGAGSGGQLTRAAGPTPGPDAVQWAIGTLEPGANRTVEVVLRSSVPGRICDQARATAAGGPSAQAEAEYHTIQGYTGGAVGKSKSRGPFLDTG